MPRPTAPSPAGSGTEPGGASGVKSARRAVDLIETFAANESWLSLGDLHTMTGVPRSSLHGLLRTLHEAGWLETDGTGGYRLGVRALICGTAYLDRDPVIPYATETLETIREKTGFTAHYARRNGDQIVYLETRESRHSAHLVSRVGRTLPAHATALGKALLAELTPDEIAAVLRRPLSALTPNTITTLDALHTACAETRERGYGLETEEGTPGVRCAAAVVPYRIPATDAVSCSMPTDQVTEQDVREVGALLAEVAAGLGRRLRREGIR
ncbi:MULTISPECIES: IclR family transcriptional regulator [Streptomyces]|uniref:IclR family transcriptional regulator n=1 Tax=Streptomyces lycii TaxID=2654337 RepID=A0ABQ7FBT1_9ACTN|nr:MULTISPECIES: IclR family transcriptional regulator [Streptomyces]KAF4406230.1 IclR family transcriptional regulator [Streptomyces lycii]PGH52215.1 IclR family transcriptional regulator [Streptomyces sp. Ru87]